MSTKILLAEDNPEIRMAVSMALEDAGFEVAVAEDGQQGWNRFQEFNPDMALLDMEMPNVSGTELCMLMRRKTDIPIIMFSGVQEQEAVLEVIKEGATDYVIKSTGIPAVIERLKSHIKPPEDTDNGESGQPAKAKKKAKPADKPASGAGEPDSEASPIDLEVKPELKDAIGPKDFSLTENVYPVAVVAVPNESDRNLAMLLAKHAGRIVFNFDNGSDAMVSVMEQNPDLIILHLNIDDMTALDFLAVLKKHPKRRKIVTIILSDMRLPEAKRRLSLAGASDVIYAPYDDGRLDLSIRNSLKKIPDGAGLVVDRPTPLDAISSTPIRV